MPYRDLRDDEEQVLEHDISDGGGGGDGGGDDNGGGGDDNGGGGGDDNGGGSQDFGNENDGDGFVGNSGDNNFSDSSGNDFSFDIRDSSNDFQPSNYRFDSGDDSGDGSSRSSRSSRSDMGNNDFYDRMRQEEDDRRAERERQDEEERQRQEEEDRQRQLAEADARRQEAEYQRSLAQNPDNVQAQTPAEIMAKEGETDLPPPVFIPPAMEPHAALGQGRYGTGARYFTDPQSGERRWITADGDVHREDRDGYTSVIRSYGPQEQEGRTLYENASVPRTQTQKDQQVAARTSVDPVFRPNAPVDLPPSDQAVAAAVPSAAPEAAGIAAHAAAAAGLPPEQVAAVAESAARLAADKQTLAQQTPWTRAAFKSVYGDNADAEWIRQHNAELERNQRLYGSREPRAGTPGLAGSGAPPAPDRRIGATPPPGPGQGARYGVNYNLKPTAPAATVSRAPLGTSSPELSANVANPQAGEPPARGALPIQPTTAQQISANVANPRDAEPPARGNVPLQPLEPTTFRPGEPPARANLPTQPVTTQPGTPEQQAIIGNAIIGNIDAAAAAARGTDRPEEGTRGYTPPSYTPAIADTRAVDEGPHEIPNSTPALTSSTSTEVGPPAAEITENGPGLGQRAFEPPSQYQPQSYRPQVDEVLPGRFTPDRNQVALDAQGNVVPDTLQGAGYSRASSTDTTYNIQPDTDPVVRAMDSPTPIDSLAQLAANAQGKGPEYDVRSDAYNIAQGIAGLIQGKPDARWSEAYLNDTARLAWAREERTAGRQADPRNAPVDYIETWKDAFYGSDHNVPLVKELDQQLIDYAASKTPPNKPFDWHIAFGQNGEKGLISQQFTGIDCGPNAFSTIARSRGVNMTPQQALPFAEQHGYHNGNEFTGPENYARMLRSELGLDAKTGRLDEAGWSAVDKELAEGRPVTLSSPGHYWVVTGKNDQGQYYAGATNTVLRGRAGQDWVGKGAFAYGGYADTFITAKGDVKPDARALQEMHLQTPAMTQQSNRANLTSMGPATVKLNDQSSGGSGDSGVAAAISDAAPSGRGNLNDSFTVADTTDMRNRISSDMPQIVFEPSDDEETRVRKAAPALDWLEREYGVPAEVMAGMIHNESHFGVAGSPAARANNLLSIQWTPQDSLSTGVIPQGRWAGYRSVNDNIARFVGMYAHPENGHQRLWANRKNPDRLMDELVRDHYVVDEPGAGNSVAEWRAGVNAGRQLYRRVAGR